MRFVIFVAIFAIGAVVLFRLNNRRATAEAVSRTEQYADRGWQAEATGGRVERHDIRVEGASPAGHRFIAYSDRTIQSGVPTVEATVTFPDLTATLSIPAVRRRKGEVSIRSVADADPAVLEAAFGADTLAHLDDMRGVVMRSVERSAGPVAFDTSNLAVGQDQLPRTIDCLDAIVTSLQRAGYVASSGPRPDS